MINWCHLCETEHIDSQCPWETVKKTRDELKSTEAYVKYLENLCRDYCIQVNQFRDTLIDVWHQFSIENEDGTRWAGGLSVLEEVEKVLK